MFKKKTVFILGAGSSWHYGYPTGEELVRMVLEKGRMFRKHCLRMRQGSDVDALAQIPLLIMDASGRTVAKGLAENRRTWLTGESMADELIRRLEAVDPLVIDYFLGHNPDLKQIGKFVIAWVLLQCEAEYSARKGNLNRQKLLDRSPDPRDRHLAPQMKLSSYGDNWYRFLIHKLVVGCADGAELLEKNNVTFVTFNYDVSLEYRLFQGLSAISFFAQDQVRNFVSNDRFIHVYGKIREDAFVDPPGFDLKLSSGDVDPKAHQHAAAYKEFFDHIYQASRSIHTIAPEEKFISEDELRRARECIASSECLYILGYGFDPQNNKLLDLRSVGRKDVDRQILFTNFQDGSNVNKRASVALFGRPDQLSLVGAAIFNYNRLCCEKSIRDVYGALSLDFDSPEET